MSTRFYAQETWLSRGIESSEFQSIGCLIQGLLERYNFEKFNIFLVEKFGS